MSVGKCLEDGFCSGKEDGNFKDPDTCYGFITCSEGRIHKKECPSGMMYNEDKEQCDDKENVECDISDGVRGTLYRGSQWGCNFDG